MTITLKAARPVLITILMLAVATRYGLAGNCGDDQTPKEPRPQLVGNPGDDPKPKKPAPPLALSELNPQHDGKEISVIFKVTDTQLIGGTRDGQYPHILLHHDRMRVRPPVNVFVHGELADAFHRFALVSPDDQFVGRTIKAAGKLTIHKPHPDEVDQYPIYKLILRDVDKFQIVRKGA